MSAAPRATFETQSAWRAWLQKHHARASELDVVLVRKGSARRGITYDQALEEALCFGWIDGVRRSIDQDYWRIRFCPRKPRSNWSAVNLRKMAALIEAGRVAPPGLKVFEARDPARERVYAFERPDAPLPKPLEQRFRRHKQAWARFEAAPPGYAKQLRYWITSAKREETRLARLDRLIDACARGVPLGQFIRER